jgi:hypothetical protein
MPFKSKAQVKACFAKKDPNWDCHKWASETPSMSKLPAQKATHKAPTISSRKKH